MMNSLATLAFELEFASDESKSMNSDMKMEGHIWFTLPTMVATIHATNGTCGNVKPFGPESNTSVYSRDGYDVLDL
jgi:hypothetical protein